MTPIVYADAGTQPKDSTVNGETTSASTSDDESLAEDQQVKKKPKREKVGFRDRKVEHFTILFDLQSWIKSRKIFETRNEGLRGKM